MKRSSVANRWSETIKLKTFWILATTIGTAWAVIETLFLMKAWSSFALIRWQNMKLPNVRVSLFVNFPIRKFYLTKNSDFYAKVCQQNGIWSLPHFSECFESKRLQANIIVHIIVISLSIVICAPATLAVVITKKVLSKTRIAFVILMSVVVSRNIFILISKLIVSCSFPSF